MRSVRKVDIKMERDVRILLKLIDEIQIEANFTLKVAYLKFSEQIKRKALMLHGSSSEQSNKEKDTLG